MGKEEQPHKTLSSGQLEALLRFYTDAGVDWLVQDEAVDWKVRSADEIAARKAALAKAADNTAQASSQQTRARTRPGAPPVSPPVSTPASTPVSLPISLQAAIPDQNAVDEARNRAQSATSLEALRQTMADFTGCNLQRTAKNLVFGDGNRDAAAMFIGGAPGRDEDLQGVPFAGRAGQLLDRMLDAIGLQRTDSRLACVIPWRPPGNRPPTAAEIAICRPFIARHVELVRPDIVILLGNLAARTMLETDIGIMETRGIWRDLDVGAEKRPVMATLDPDYLLRNPAHKKLAWADFIEIACRLDAITDQKTR